MNCGKCNAELIEGARFCSVCGSGFEAPAAEDASSQAPPAAATPPPEVTRPAVSPSQPTVEQAVPDWGQELARLWARIGSGQLLAAGILGGLGLIFAIVGLQMALASDAFSSGEFHGSIWLGLATILILAAIGWASAARAQLRERGVWSPSTDLLVAGGAGALAVIFGFVTVGVGLSFDQLGGGSTQDIGAWATFAQLWAFLALGWLVFTRPLDARTSQLFGGIGTGLALLLGFIGLASGLGDSTEDFVHGGSWLSIAIVFAILATGSLFGHSSS